MYEKRPNRGGMRKKKVCQFCADKAETIDYKDVEKGFQKPPFPENRFYRHLGTWLQEDS